MESPMLIRMGTQVREVVKILVLKVVEVELILPVSQLGMEVVVVAVKEIKVMMRVKGYTLRYPQLNHLVGNPPPKQPSTPPIGETKGPERPLIKD